VSCRCVSALACTVELSDQMVELQILIRRCISSSGAAAAIRTLRCSHRGLEEAFDQSNGIGVPGELSPVVLAVTGSLQHDVTLCCLVQRAAALWCLVHRAAALWCLVQRATESVKWTCFCFTGGSGTGSCPAGAPFLARFFRGLLCLGVEPPSLGVDPPSLGVDPPCLGVDPPFLGVEPTGRATSGSAGGLDSDTMCAVASVGAGAFFVTSSSPLLVARGEDGCLRDCCCCWLRGDCVCLRGDCCLWDRGSFRGLFARLFGALLAGTTASMGACEPYIGETVGATTDDCCRFALMI